MNCMVLGKFLFILLKTKNFAFEVIFVIGLESIHPDGKVAMIGLNGCINE